MAKPRVPKKVFTGEKPQGIRKVSTVTPNGQSRLNGLGTRRAGRPKMQDTKQVRAAKKGTPNG